MRVLQELHQYVPFDGDDDERVYGQQGVVGDQLSVERGVNGHCSMANGFTPEERLEGLYFEIADWHGGNEFTEVGRYHSCMNFSYNHVILRRFHGNYWLATDSRFHNKTIYCGKYVAALESVPSVEIYANYFFFNLYRHFLSKSYLTQDKLANCQKQ